MGLFRALSGSVQVELSSADPAGNLEDIVALGIPVSSVKEVDEITIRFSVSHKDYRSLSGYAERKGANLHKCAAQGALWSLLRLVKRPVFVLGLSGLVFASCLLQGSILFVSVEGNETVPDAQILDAAAQCGIHFGASRWDVRSEAVKNELLAQLPKLQWAGVNTYGSHAVITVRERTTDVLEEPSGAISKITAACDGIVTSVTVTDGTALCSVGQAVTKGQTLISGYSEFGQTIVASRAEGEIIAQTGRGITVVCPQVGLRKVLKESSRRNFSVIIGKKRINLCNGSGISGGSCVKMYSKYVLKLPGGFELPVSLVVETLTDSAVHAVKIPEGEAKVLLAEFAQTYLDEQMIAGTVLSKAEHLVLYSGTYRLVGRYVCSEMIGRQQDEMIGEYYGKTNGTDRERGSGG